MRRRDPRAARGRRPRNSAVFARSRLRRILDWGLVALLFAACGLIVLRLEEVSVRTATGPARVVDGDTLALEGTRIRLTGIDAFERDQTCTRAGATYACGAEASRRLAGLVAGARPVCTGRTVDRYARLLATCTAGGRDLNAAMVESGWALAWGDYSAQEQSARSARRGAWAGEFALPADWRAGRGGPHEARQNRLQRIFDLIVQILTGRGEMRDEAL